MLSILLLDSNAVSTDIDLAVVKGDALGFGEAVTTGGGPGVRPDASSIGPHVLGQRNPRLRPTIKLAIRSRGGRR
jgi:hypothetical protein